MDKSWIEMPRNTPQYMEGLKTFLDFSFANSSVRGEIVCPCPKCNFNKWQCREIVYEHLIIKPFPKGYTVWLLHGERKGANVTDEIHVMPRENDEVIPANNPMCDMINDAFGYHEYNDDMVDDRETGAESSHNMNDDLGDFFQLMQEGQESLYEGCDKYSKLSFLIKLYHIKCMCRITNKGMSMILELLANAFGHAKIPSSFYEAKKIINKLGLHYTKIDACPNDCMLYFGEDANMDFCKKCKTSRWKAKKKGTSDSGTSNKRKKIPAKVLRYFPLKPRLQRMFMSSKIAEHMRWHASKSTNEDILRHPRDSKAWKTFDLKHPQFASDPRNVRLGLATDGFNPYGNLSTSYSIWPVVLIPYNLPPWMCLKQSSFILSMIILGKRAPGNDIDVYLQPLIEELKELWSTGIKTFDSYGNEVFDMHAAVLWTISDFPGLGTLSGWNTHTGLACPRCNFDTTPKKLLKGGKFCFMSHRRWLDGRHRFRLARMRFDGTIENRNPPVVVSGYDVLQQVENVNVEFGKEPVLEERAKRQRGVNHAKLDTQQWRKKSIFFELPYWVDNLLHHNLDVMHIEKNVCDNVVFTLLNDSSNKCKDNLKARKDLQLWGIRPDLWPDENGRYLPAIYTLTNANKDIFLKTLKNMTVPNGYSSNISRCIDVKQRKLGGLKSHDSHVLMEQLLPSAMRNTLPKEVCSILVDLCMFFRQLCNKVLRMDELDQLQSRVVLTLCYMEMLFPPSFFTVMIHLIVHLVEDAKLGGPVQYRWMYPIERWN
ncbi:uncharacterized protein LOC114172283 [Vigna unguiculata]|uniref:uncharacterized protein LOC114172283 n=1 Tax=Vigna unguiculata TaxID=3917 RepID=UPI001015D68E|nr:uncharacterized protein LOC114172283 [Vigna unguiculata]